MSNLQLSNSLTRRDSVQWKKYCCTLAIWRITTGTGDPLGQRNAETANYKIQIDYFVSITNLWLRKSPTIRTAEPFYINNFGRTHSFEFIAGLNAFVIKLVNGSDTRHNASTLCHGKKHQKLVGDLTCRKRTFVINSSTFICLIFETARFIVRWLGRLSLGEGYLGKLCVDLLLINWYMERVRLGTFSE